MGLRDKFTQIQLPTPLLGKKQQQCIEKNGSSKSDYQPE